MKNFHLDASLWIKSFFVLSLLFSLWAVSIGWTHTIMDAHSFRQSQTALSIYYLTENWQWLAYETPVLGAPWSIPFEFPLYQQIVAILVKLFGFSIESTGRFVSVSFFYLSLIPLYVILREIKVQALHRLAVLALFLLSPQYLFWSRTLMIESTAFFLALSYLALTICWLHYKRTSYLIAAALFASLAAMVKVTTLVGFGLASIFFICLYWQRKYQWSFEKDAIKHNVIALLFLGILPLVAAKLWTSYADAQKMLNPFAEFIESSSLFLWNFGTLEQRMAGSTWYMIFRNMIHDAIGHRSFFLFSLLCLFAMPKYKAYFLLCLALFLSAPMIFTNLHLVHNYYSYANCVFLIAAVACVLVALLESKGWRKNLAFVVMLFAFIVGTREWYRRHYFTQSKNYTAILALADKVKEVTNEKEVILIWGRDWDSSVAYHAKRRALMDRDNRDLQQAEMQAMLKNLKDYTIGAMLICNGRHSDENFVSQRALQFNLSSKAIFQSYGCHLFPKRSI